MPKRFSGDGFQIDDLPEGQWRAFRVCTKCKGTGRFPPSGPQHPAQFTPSERCPVGDCEDGARVCRAATRAELKMFADAPDPT
jgi:hypothetical protein